MPDPGQTVGRALRMRGQTTASTDGVTVFHVSSPRPVEPRVRAGCRARAIAHAARALSRGKHERRVHVQRDEDG
ncbi:hypothetical protein [Streptomyces sp. NPDC059928]|uniref:hypothetical protein n=1 Tax=unclassified Streptomyces TaxID=2593676 RepID=UPI00365BEDA8